MIGRIRDNLNLTPSLSLLFAHPVLSDLASAINGCDGRSLGPPITLIDRGGLIPLSFAQQRLWVLAQLEGPSATYNMPAALRLKGHLDVGALQRSLDGLFARHEALTSSTTHLCPLADQSSTRGSTCWTTASILFRWEQ